MILVNSVSVHYGATEIFSNITFLINKNDRIGLAGRNGAGKSTLLKIIAGERKSDTGNIEFPNDTTVGFLHQDLKAMHGLTVFEAAKEAFAEVLRLEKRLEDISHELTIATDTESPAYTQLLDDMHHVMEHLQYMDASKADSQTERVLMGLGFEREHFERDVATFSGGWQMRIELAKILLQQPDVLLLDEPTNHLDIDSIQWLENFLKTYSGALILVSHDRAFLDAVTTRTIEIVNGKAHDYKASYSQYLILREERRQHQMNVQKNQQREIARTEALIDKFRAKASKAAMAQSLIKQLDKMELTQVDDMDNSAMSFYFPDPPRSGSVVYTAEHLTKAYGDHVILKDINLQVERGDRIAFVGRNGEGKTTLTKIMGGEEPYQGISKIGHNVEIGYYAQHQAEKLDPNSTVLKTLEDVAPDGMRARIRNLLGCFLFSGEDVEKRVKVLSGGEKSRLALAKLLLFPCNLLILDEPTNHLDLMSKEVLKNALLHYEGTMIVVSHDRDFLQGLTDKLYWFSNQGIKEHLGDIQSFLEKRQLDSLKILETKKVADQKAKETSKQAGKQTSNTPSTSNTPTPPVDKQLQREIQKHEKLIADMERELKQLEAKLAETENLSPGEITELAHKYDHAKTAYDKAYAAWAELAEKA